MMLMTLNQDLMEIPTQKMKRLQLKVMMMTMTMMMMMRKMKRILKIQLMHLGNPVQSLLHADLYRNHLMHVRKESAVNQKQRKHV